MKIDFTECPVPVLQHEREFERFMEIYENHSPKKVVEIGSFFGGTLWYFHKHAKLEQLTSVDLLIPPADERYQQMVECRALWHEWFADSGVRMSVIEGDSHNESIINTVKLLYPENDVDVLHIDGDHSYQGVMWDYDNFKGLVRPGGMIVFHDIHGLEQVRQAWDEIKAKHSHTQTIIEAYDQGWGIGIIHV